MNRRKAEMMLCRVVQTRLWLCVALAAVPTACTRDAPGAAHNTHPTDGGARGDAGGETRPGPDASDASDEPHAGDSNFAVGRVSTVAQGIGLADGLVLRDDGKFLVSNSEMGAVSEVTLDGETTTFASGLMRPFGMALDSAGNLLVADWNAQKVKRISPQGEVEDFAEVDDSVGNVWVDPEDNVYIPFSTLGRLDKITPDGTRTTIAQLPADETFHSVVLDDRGQLYAGMVRSGRIYKIDPDGGYEDFAQLPGEFEFKLGNLIFFRGSLIATTTGGNRVLRISRAGEVEPIAGSGTAGGRDGPADEAQFLAPVGLAQSRDGNTLYVSDRIGTIRALEIIADP